MSRYASRTSTISPGGARRRRWGRGTGWTCPDCGLATSDPVAIRLGFCGHCREFTGMCGAGRRIICPDMMSVTAWHAPCTSLGTTPWRITVGPRQHIALLCATHDGQLRTGSAPWISEAVPLDELGPSHPG